MNSQIAQTASGLIEYTLSGDGPVVFVCHGTSSNCYATAAAKPLLEAGFRVLTPSRPGYGRTPQIGWHDRGPGSRAAEYAVRLKTVWTNDTRRRTAMQALALDGSRAGDSTGQRVLAALRDEMQTRGWEVEHLLLREMKIGNCAGDFFCWIRTPGVCNIDDDNRRIAHAVVGSDLLVFLTPVTFGGYSSELKRAVDHLTQNNLPFFTHVDGEVHHPPRYAHNPKLLAIGWLNTPQPSREAIFHSLARRNAINMHHATSVSGVVYADQSDEHLARAIGAWIGDVENGRSSRPVELPRMASTRSEVAAIRRALLLVGSPRGSKSTSQSLGGFLFEQLGAHRIETETIHLYPALGSRSRTQALLEAVDAHDLIVLAFPVYIDSLPGPVMRALELIATHRAATRRVPKPALQAFAAIANCGLPDAKNNRTALAICATFAQDAQFAWAGSLALGCGEGVVTGNHWRHWVGAPIQSGPRWP